MAGKHACDLNAHVPEVFALGREILLLRCGFGPSREMYIFISLHKYVYTDVTCLQPVVVVHHDVGAWADGGEDGKQLDAESLQMRLEEGVGRLRVGI